MISAFLKRDFLHSAAAASICTRTEAIAGLPFKTDRRYARAAEERRVSSVCRTIGVSLSMRPNQSGRLRNACGVTDVSPACLRSLLFQRSMRADVFGTD